MCRAPERGSGPGQFSLLHGQTRSRALEAYTKRKILTDLRIKRARVQTPRLPSRRVCQTCVHTRVLREAQGREVQSRGIAGPTQPPGRHQHGLSGGLASVAGSRYRHLACGDTILGVREESIALSQPAVLPTQLHLAPLLLHAKLPPSNRARRPMTPGAAQQGQMTRPGGRIPWPWPGVCSLGSCRPVPPSQMQMPPGSPLFPTLPEGPPLPETARALSH